MSDPATTGVGVWSSLRVWRGVAAAVVVGTLLTVAVVVLVAREQRDDLQAELDALVLDAAGRVARRVGLVDQTLLTLSAELRVDRADLERFTAIVDAGELVEVTRGVQSLSVAREYPIPGPERPLGGGTSLVVERIVPVELGVGLAGDLDLYDRGEERRRATTAARDRATPAATAPLELAYGGTGILYYSPVYVGDADTIEERRANFLGVSIAVVEPVQLFDELLGPTPLVEVLVEDLGPITEPPTSAITVWSSHAAATGEGTRTEAEQIVADRRWRISVVPTNLLVSSSLAVLATALGGAFLTIALAALAATMLGARDRLERVVEIRTSELTTAYQLQSQFVSTVSHELRTPLTAVLGFIETVRARGGDDSIDSDDLLARAERQGRQLDRMVQQLLDFGRIERGHVQLSPEPSDLTELVPRLIEDLGPVVGNRGVEVTIDAPQGAPALVDRGALSRVLGNLLENAVRYAPTDTPIQVGVTAETDVVRVTVADDGPGVDPEDAPFVFEQFYRGRGQMGKGTGIGLAVVRQLIDGHGGRVDLDQRPGGGTLVTIELPRLGATFEGSAPAP